MNEKWMVYTKKADFASLSKALCVSPVICRIMRNRGLVEKEEMEDYLYGTPQRMHSPWLMKDMEKAVDILLDKIQNKKKIRIISDYDIDGICSGYILTNGLKAAYGKDGNGQAGLTALVDLAIPDRLTDGYGINERLIREAGRGGVDTIITCDNGIAAADAVYAAKELGLTVIITDHHGIPFRDENGDRIYLLPEADAVVNPKQNDCAYPFKELCGAGIAWKLVTALYEKLGFSPERKDQYLVFAAIATIGDVVDLNGENRLIAKWGLKALRDTGNIGLRALVDACRLDIRRISSYHIGFVLGPCLNASGRLDTALKAVAMLNAGSREKADMLACELKMLNDARKEMTEEQVGRAKKEAEKVPEDQVLVLYLPDCHESIAGIVAGRVREAYYKPTLIFTDSEDGIKGSGRSTENYDMFEKMSECRELFTRFGGHKMAAGFSAEKENLGKIHDYLNKHADLSAEDRTKKIWIDAAVPFSYATESLVEELSMLEPFGKGNEKPVFAQKQVALLKYRILGKNQNVIRLELAGEDGSRISGVYFKEGMEWEAFLTGKFGKDECARAKYGERNSIRLSLLYYPVIDDYTGGVQARIQAVL